MGTAAVSDQCTTVGPKLIDPIITLAPGEVSTFKPPALYWLDGYDKFTAGEVWQDPSGIPGYDDAEGIAPLEIKDLACPTWGLGTSTSADGTVVTTIGPPWLPLIIPPTQIFSLDPIWEAMCTGLFSDSFGLTTFALFDPPIALTPASLLVPTPPTRSTPAPVSTPADPTTVPERATSYAATAKPASQPHDPVAPPARTGDPGKESPSQSPVLSSAEPASSPQNSGASSKDKGDPPADPPLDPEVVSVSAGTGDTPSGTPSDPKGPLVPAGAGDPPAESVGASTASDSSSDDSQQSPTDANDPTIPATLQGESPQAQSQGLGAIIYNAFGRLGPDGSGTQSAVNIPSLSPQSIFAIDAQTFTANPTGFKVNDAAVTPGGTALTVDGTIIRLDPSGVLTVGSSTISLTTPATAPVLAVAGQTFTPNPSAFSIAGTIVSAGGPAVKVGGTTISLDQAGALAIGSTTISLATPPSNPSATRAFTVAGQTFTPNPSAFSIAGTTISANGPAVTISGTVISLGHAGVLTIGSSTISLPTPSDPPLSRVYTVAGQTFTPNPSAFSIAGTTVSAGGSAVTVGGTIISLQPSGTLLIGSSTIQLSTTPQAISSSSDVDVDGVDIQAESSSFVVVDGVTLSAGAAGVPVSGGKVVSLEAGGGYLFIVRGRFALPCPTGSAANGSSTADVQAFTGGGQGKRELGLSLLLLVVCGVCGTSFMVLVI